jgi:hypothetical protein
MPATLSEAAADPAVLRNLDLDDTTPYPVRAKDVEEVVALIAASPAELSRRMALVESQLAGKQRLVLTVDASGQAERFTANEHVRKAELWPLPYVTLAQQLSLKDHPRLIQKRMTEMAPFQVGPNAPLWKGRALHFKGRFVGEESATHYYQIARPSDRELENLSEIYFQAFKGAQPEADATKLREAALQRAAADKPLFVRAKQDASYWLGLVAYSRGTYPAAIDYLAKRTLAASPDGPWTHGARYNLARTYEASGETHEAISQLAADPLSPARHGNLLRARWLNDLLAQRNAEAGEDEQNSPEVDKVED